MAGSNSRRRRAGIKLYFCPPAKTKSTDGTNHQVESNSVLVIGGGDIVEQQLQGFNTEFEEIYQIQKTYAVPDPQLREEIRNKNFNLIVPLYTTFREKYEGVPFTKNPEKYVKYSAEKVGNLINKFFDVSA